MSCPMYDRLPDHFGPAVQFKTMVMGVGGRIAGLGIDMETASVAVGDIMRPQRIHAGGNSCLEQRFRDAE